jgi:hypothetical protein
MTESQRRPLALCEMALRRADRIAVDAPCRDLCAPSAFKRVVETNHDGTVRDEGADQQTA